MQHSDDKTNVRERSGVSATIEGMLSRSEKARFSRLVMLSYMSVAAIVFIISMSVPASWAYVLDCSMVYLLSLVAFWALENFLPIRFLPFSSHSDRWGLVLKQEKEGAADLVFKAAGLKMCFLESNRSMTTNSA